MKSSTSKSELFMKAGVAFRKEDYETALALYKEASKTFGENTCRANIIICERRLANNKHKQKDPQDVPSNRMSRVACIMDSFTFQSFTPECSLLQITPDNSEKELASFSPDILFVESAWHGNDGAWNRKISSPSEPLTRALDWCKIHNVPTVFWNKEDPIHFETFLNTANLFDFVFTTDIDCIARYKRELEHNRIFLLPFACQPRVHNPIEIYERKDAFCFAGAYYTRYPERTRDLDEFTNHLPRHKPLEIFDRNHENTGDEFKDYRFPEKYHSFIVGSLPFSEIEKAYKGYRYAINLNSIKQSQTMFARRVYELLGSNTLTISNFSRGVRSMFGDLVISSDSSHEIIKRLKGLNLKDEQRLRLAGLRKVMLEHTYKHRLEYILSKTLGIKIEPRLIPMLVVGNIQNNGELKAFIESYTRQVHKRKKAIALIGDNCIFNSLDTCGNDLEVFKEYSQAIIRVCELGEEGYWLAPFVQNDYYGPNYLTDLAVATSYCSADVVGKTSVYIHDGSELRLVNETHSYHYLKEGQFSLRSSAAKIKSLGKKYLIESSWLNNLASKYWPSPGFSTDPFNYACNSHALPFEKVSESVDDQITDTGVSCEDLLDTAEAINPSKTYKKKQNCVAWSGKHMHSILQDPPKEITFAVLNGCLLVQSNLPDEKHEYIYNSQDFPLASIPGDKKLTTHLQASPGLNIQFVFIYLDKNKTKLGHKIHNVNLNSSSDIPDHTEFIRFGLRIYGKGSSSIKALNWSHLDLEPPQIKSKAKYLLVTNQYPSYDDIYRYGFVHSRILEYEKKGIQVDVFRLKETEALSFHEFQGIDCITGSSNSLKILLNNNSYNSILVHFLTESIWSVLEPFAKTKRIIVWVHGSEIQPWYRRDFNYITKTDREKAELDSKRRETFWRRIFSSIPPSLHLVFVSRYFAEEVMEDYSIDLDAQSYSVIHNAIDTDLFDYRAKDAEQRNKILSIRPYASRQYANDLAVSAILELSKKHFFKQLEFRIIGDGLLFNDLLKPLHLFDNIFIEKKFLRREEIADMHKQYGLFLCPTRWDSQGVSRDEAMSSGLVPITTAVAAVPEFVNTSSGFLAPPDNYTNLAESIETMHKNPSLFLSLSKAAAYQVRQLSASRLVIEEELNLIINSRGPH